MEKITDLAENTKCPACQSLWNYFLERMQSQTCLSFVEHRNSLNFLKVIKLTSLLLIFVGNVLGNVPDVSQQRSVTGRVTDSEGNPLPGVSVVIKGTSDGTITNIDGEFSFPQIPSDATLQFSFIGMKSQEIPVRKQTSVIVVMEEESVGLEEVVVVGYGVQKKVNLSGAVQAVSSKSLTDRPVTNMNQALQGLAANVNITLMDGRANSAPDINVRGFTSINGGSALILVDNVPVTSEELSRINPEDIESMSVLKDAASAAIYGGRAAFGVILITTKTAKTTKLEISFDGNFGVRKLGRTADVITDPATLMYLSNETRPAKDLWTEAEMEYVRQMTANPELYPNVIVANRSNSIYSAGNWAYFDNVDWKKVVFREASPSYTGNIRIGQKTEKMSYAVSGNYYKQEGMLNNGNDIFNRYNFRGKGTYKMTNWWEVGSNISFVQSKYNTAEAMDEGYFFHMYRSPLRSIYNPDGTYTSAGAWIVGLMKEGGRRIQYTNETQVSLNTTFDVVKDIWQIKADANYRFTNGHYNMSHYPVYARLGPDKPLNAVYFAKGEGLQNSIYAENGSALNTYRVYNIYTDFHKTFAGKHYVSATIGYNQEELRYTSNMSRKSDLISISLPSVQLATGTAQTGESINTLALRGVFGRLNYIFDNKYIIEFNGRRDGTSRYPKEQRFGFFPSGSVAWVISREPFFAPLAEKAEITNLKLRASYGSLGNQASGGYYPYIATMSSGTIGIPINGNMPTAVYQPGVVSNSLTWETVNTINGGIDLALFDNRINLGFDIYNRRTLDMLVQSKTLPAVFGAAPPKTNAGDLKTKGWELTIGLNETFNVAGSPLRLGLDFMLADSRTWITKYDNETRGISRGDGSANYYEGQELGEIWGFVSDGFLKKEDLIYDENGKPTGNAKIDQYDVSEEDNRAYGVSHEGDIKFKDLNGDGKINFGKGTVSDPGDRKIIGNSLARLPYSFTLTGDWKGFDLRAFFQGVGKRDWYPGGNHHDFWGVYGNPWGMAIKENLDHWTPENPNAKWPRLKAYIAENLELALPQTAYLQDASYLRLKNLTIGYTLPVKLTSKFNISKLRLYVSGENLLTISHLDVDGVDPEGLTTSVIQWRGGGTITEEGSNYPLQKVFSFGLNINF